MICSQMQIGGRNGTHSPFRFGGKSIGFVVACGTKKRISFDEPGFCQKRVSLFFLSLSQYLNLTQLKKRARNKFNTHIKI